MIMKKFWKGLDGFGISNDFMMSDQNREQLVRGNLAYLPPDASSVVRIFISSTFSDFQAERNLLVTEIYPTLRGFCHSLGLEFQVVDMRYGVRDDETDRHLVSQLCLDEINRCQSLSVGPTFVVFLGNRYGFRPLPHYIDKDELECLVKIAKAEDLPTEELNDWYSLDENAIPERYELQRISAKLQFYLDTNPYNQHKRKRDQETWWTVSNVMKTSLEKTAQIALNRNLMKESDARKYLVSVTEMEIEEGILGSNNPEAQCVCFKREMEGISFEDPLSCKYTDIIDGKQDTHALEKLNNLKNRTLTQLERRLNSCVVLNESIPWTPKGVDPSNIKHYEYLQKFSEVFIKSMKQKIVRGLQKQSMGICRDRLYMEYIHHAQTAISKSKQSSRKEVASKIFDYIRKTEKKNSLVVHGNTGCGKSTLIASVIRDMYEELGENVLCVYRFIGTSPYSNSLKDVLSGLCLQLCEIFKLQPPSPDVFNHTNNLKRCLRSILHKLSSSLVSENQQLVLVLDSVHRLSSSNLTVGGLWIPLILPPNVSLIVTIAQKHLMFTKLQSRLSDPSYFVAVGDIQYETSVSTVANHLESCNRKITKEQMKVVKSMLQQCQRPLYLRLLMDEAENWRSFEQIEVSQMPLSVSDSILQGYRKLEISHGPILVKRTLGYICSSRHGLSDKEIEDVLSLDNDVLDEVYHYWFPAADDTVRIPPLIWGQLRESLSDFLVQKFADGKRVWTLYHDDLIQAVNEIYLDEEEKRTVHSNLADYFLGIWGKGKKKPITFNTKGKNAQFHMDRSVCSQPLMYQTCCNYRKVAELPFHLIHSHKWHLLVDSVLGNFEFLKVKAETLSVNDVLQDFNLAAEISKDPEIKLIRDAFRLAKPTLEYDETSFSLLPQEFLGRMLHLTFHYKTYIPHILRLFKEHLTSLPNACLIPVKAWIPPPGGILRDTLSGHNGRVTLMCAKDDTIVSAATDNTVRYWNLHENSALQIFKLSEITESVKNILIIRELSRIVTLQRNTLTIWDMDTGDYYLIREIPENLQSGEEYDIVYPQGQDYILCIAKHEVKKFCLNTGSFVRLIQSTEIITTAALCTGDTCIAIGRESGYLEICDIENGEVLHFLAVTQNPIIHLLGVNESMLLCISMDLFLSVIDTKSNELHETVMLPKNNGKLLCCSVSKYGKHAAFGVGNTLVLVDLIKVKIIKAFEAHQESILSTAFMQRNTTEWVITGSADHTCKIWDAQSGKYIRRILGMLGEVNHMTVHETLLITGSSDQPYIRVWNLENEQTPDIPRFEVTDKTSLLEPAIDLEGRHIVIRANDRSDFVVYDLNFTESVTRMRAHAEGVTGIGCYTKRNVSYGITSGEDGMLKIWDLFNRMLVKEFPVDKPVERVIVDPVSHLCLVELEGGSFVIFDLQAEKIVEYLTINTGNVARVHFDSGKGVVITESGVMHTFMFDSIDPKVQGRTKLSEVSVSAYDATCSSLVLSDGINIEVWDSNIMELLIEAKHESNKIVRLAIHKTIYGIFIIVGDCSHILSLYKVDRRLVQLATSQYMYGNIMSVSSYQDHILVATTLGYLATFRLHIPRVRRPSKTKEAQRDQDLEDDDELSEFVKVHRRSLLFTSSSFNLFSKSSVKKNKIMPIQEGKASNSSINACNLCSEACSIL